MRKCKILSYVLFILLMMTSIVSAEEKIVEECTYPTGKIIGFPTYRVSYEISDTHVAEVFKASNGELRVRFINPGDVYVRVIFYSGGLVKGKARFSCFLCICANYQLKNPRFYATIFEIMHTNNLNTIFEEGLKDGR